jgi:predicted DNA-binding transcriptional regulator YafY
MEGIILLPGKQYKFTYCNHEGKTEIRHAIMEGVSYGTFPFHSHKCWVMHAFCLARQARRTFELGRIADDIMQVS